MINIPSIKSSKLDLKNLNLKEFPIEILEMKNLKKLYLSGNQISIIPKEIEKLKYLKVLDLSNNRIINFQSKICALRQLKILNLNNNLIKTIPTQIENLRELQILQLANNSIQKFPTSFENLTNLRELNISKNLFKLFPSEILRLKELQSLWVNDLDFQTFPLSEISKIDRLKHLYCFGLLKSYSIDKNYHELTKIKGNSLSKLKLLSNVKKTETAEEAIPEKVSVIPQKIFISYSHKDYYWLEQVKINLKVLRYNDHDFELWDDTKMKGSEKWRQEIQKALNNSGIAILLVSTYFLSSEFIRNEELPKLLNNANLHGTKILPLIVRPCYFTKDKLSIYQSVNDPNKALNTLEEHEWERELVNFTTVISNILING